MPYVPDPDIVCRVERQVASNPHGRTCAQQRNPKEGEGGGGGGGRGVRYTHTHILYICTPIHTPYIFIPINDPTHYIGVRYVGHAYVYSHTLYICTPIHTPYIFIPINDPTHYIGAKYVGHAYVYTHTLYIYTPMHTPCIHTCLYLIAHPGYPTHISISTAYIYPCQMELGLGHCSVRGGRESYHLRPGKKVGVGAGGRVGKGRERGCVGGVFPCVRIE